MLLVLEVLVREPSALIANDVGVLGCVNESVRGRVKFGFDFSMFGLLRFTTHHIVDWHYAAVLH